LLETAEGGLFRVGEALGADAEEDGDTVAGPFGDLGGGNACVEPSGQAGVAEVVGAFGEGWGFLGGRESGLAGFLPDAAVDGVGGQTAAFAAEEASIGGGAVLGDVFTEQFAEGWGDGDGADFVGGAVLEVASFSPVVPASSATSRRRRRMSTTIRSTLWTCGGSM
jgi:hypothetical protein